VTAHHTVTEARRKLAQSFREVGLDTPDLDARILVGHALGLDHTALVTQDNRGLTSTEASKIAAAADRRLAREPVARIVGVKEFWALPLSLTPDTLVPRPETETVVEVALAVLRPCAESARDLMMADLGTGSGALLLALLSELPTARGVGTDISIGALTCARANAAALGFTSRASFVACDHATALCPAFDLIVANPPYVARADIAGLEPEVKDFEPRLALDGGNDGLAAYRTIAADAPRLLAPDGVLVVELGMGQLDAVTALFSTAGLSPVGQHRCDLAAVPRALAVKVSS
jgi:release factor glutamine methyltransferase